MNRPKDTLAVRRRLRLTIGLSWLLALATTVLVIGGLNHRSARQAALPVLTEVPDFNLVDHEGQAVDRETLLGKPWVADFIFTRCPGICPTLTRRMVDLAKDLPDDRVRLVSISVDPEHDTPEVLAAYAESHGAKASWRFLTGPPTAIYSLIRDGFLLTVDPSPPAAATDPATIEPIVHSNRFVLVDADGRVRGYYNAFDADELKALRVDIERLLDS